LRRFPGVRRRPTVRALAQRGSAAGLAGRLAGRGIGCPPSVGESKAHAGAVRGLSRAVEAPHASWPPSLVALWPPRTATARMDPSKGVSGGRCSVDDSHDQERGGAVLELGDGSVAPSKLPLDSRGRAVPEP